MGRATEQNGICHTKGKTMTSRFTASLMTAAATLAIPALVFTASAPAAAQSAVTRPAQDIALAIGRGQLITVPGRMTDVFVADEAIADVQVKSTNQLYLMGKAGGVTTVYASDGAGHVIWSANVRVGTNIDSVDQMLRMAMPEAHIAVSTIGSDTVLLTGTIAAPEDAAEAQRLVGAFMKTTNVITRLRMATPLQVNLQVRIAEVARSLSKNLGVNLATADTTGGFQFGIGQGRPFGPQWTPGGPLGVGVTAGAAGSTVVTTNDKTTTLAGAGRLFGLDLLGTLDAGETAGLVTTLAQPNLTAISGETAEFLAGGEFPIPSSQGLGATSIEYKKYGVSLSYTPTVLANGRISIRVRPEVSELGQTIRQNGFDVPTIVTRRAETTVELGSGQSFMIAGLLKNSTTNTVQKLPGAGDIPILGALFRSTGFQRGETELVIVVTPYLVQPVDASQIKLPTDGYQAPNDVQRIFGNMQSDGKSGAQSQKPHEAAPNQQTTPPAPQVGAAAPAPAAAELAAAPAKAGKGKSDAGAQPGFSLK